MQLMAPKTAWSEKKIQRDLDDSDDEADQPDLHTSTISILSDSDE